MSRSGSTLRERQERENREKEREEGRIRRIQLHQERSERRINREIRREIIEGNPSISNPVYSPSPIQLRSPLHFTNLTVSREESELGNSPGLPIPQNSPEEVRHPTSPEVQTPPSTTFFSAITSRVERAVQNIISPGRENPQGVPLDGNVLEIPTRVEPNDLTNIGEPYEFLNSPPDTSIRNLFHTPSLLPPFDESYSPFEGLHSIGRPLGENLISPPNRILSISNSQVSRLLNNSNFGRNRIESNKGLILLDSLQRESNLPLEPVLPLLTITQLGEEENLETKVLVNPRRGTPSNSYSSSSDPPTPPSPP